MGRANFRVIVEWLGSVAQCDTFQTPCCPCIYTDVYVLFVKLIHTNFSL